MRTYDAWFSRYALRNRFDVFLSTFLTHSESRKFRIVDFSLPVARKGLSFKQTESDR